LFICCHVYDYFEINVLSLVLQKYSFFFEKYNVTAFFKLLFASYYNIEHENRKNDAHKHRVHRYSCILSKKHNILHLHVSHAKQRNQ